MATTLTSPFRAHCRKWELIRNHGEWRGEEGMVCSNCWLALRGVYSVFLVGNWYHRSSRRTERQRGWCVFISCSLHDRIFVYAGSLWVVREDTSGTTAYAQGGCLPYAYTANCATETTDRSGCKCSLVQLLAIEVFLVM